MGLAQSFPSPTIPPLIIVNIIKAKAGEGSRVARITRTAAREPGTYSAGTGFPHDMLGFPRGTFHKDCGAGTGDVLCGNLVPARQVWIPALHVSQRLWCGSRRHIVWEPGSGATCWEAAAKLKEQKRKKAYHKTPSGIKADTKKVKKRRLKQQKEREKRRKGTAPATRPLHSSTTRV